MTGKTDWSKWPPNLEELRPHIIAVLEDVWATESFDVPDPDVTEVLASFDPEQEP